MKKRMHNHKMSSRFWKRALVAILLVMALCAVMWGISSVVDYRLMRLKEQLKYQLCKEYDEYHSALFDEVYVLRPWYSLSPENWVFVVELTNNRGQHKYMLRAGVKGVIFDPVA